MRERNYRKTQLLKDTSKRNLMTRAEKRDILVGILYAFADLYEDHADILLDDKKTIRFLKKELVRNDWILVKDIPNGIRLEPGKVKTPYFHMRKRMLYGQEHKKVLFKTLHLLRTPYFLEMLALAHGNQQEDIMSIDLSSYCKEDIQCIYRWLHQILHLDCTIKQHHLIYSEQDYRTAKEREFDS